MALIGIYLCMLLLHISSLCYICNVHGPNNLSILATQKLFCQNNLASVKEKVHQSPEHAACE